MHSRIVGSSTNCFSRRSLRSSASLRWMLPFQFGCGELVHQPASIRNMPSIRLEDEPQRLLHRTRGSQRSSRRVFSIFGTRFCTSW